MIWKREINKYSIMSFYRTWNNFRLLTQSTVSLSKESLAITAQQWVVLSRRKWLESLTCRKLVKKWVICRSKIDCTINSCFGTAAKLPLSSPLWGKDHACQQQRRQSHFPSVEESIWLTHSVGQRASAAQRSKVLILTKTSLVLCSCVKLHLVKCTKLMSQISSRRGHQFTVTQCTPLASKSLLS